MSGRRETQVKDVGDGAYRPALQVTVRASISLAADAL